WSSSFGAQPDNSTIFIDQVTAYGLSPDLQQAYLVDVRISALLYNESNGESRVFQTQRLSIPLSHL
ncbi:MAG TPA: hypothetical protein PLR30_07060, partial [Saprospiraceae bacterium]|nr:hypothetical protein [Saprospiraceae bacterium]